MSNLQAVQRRGPCDPIHGQSFVPKLASLQLILFGVRAPGVDILLAFIACASSRLKFPHDDSKIRSLQIDESFIRLKLLQGTAVDHCRISGQNNDSGLDEAVSNIPDRQALDKHSSKCWEVVR